MLQKKTFEVHRFLICIMALTYYDPLSDLYFGLPSLRNQWGFSPSWAHWEESLVPRALTVPVQEVVSDKDKFQVWLLDLIVKLNI
jgi:hypothetical protein